MCAGIASVSKSSDAPVNISNIVTALHVGPERINVLCLLGIFVGVRGALAQYFAGSKVRVYYGTAKATSLRVVLFWCTFLRHVIGCTKILSQQLSL